MRLLTVNLWNGRADPAAFAALLERLDPDLLVAQEVSVEAAGVVLAHFPHGRAEGRYDTAGRAIAGRLPMSVESLDLPHRPGYRARVELAGADVEVLGVHLANPVDGPAKLRQRRDQVEYLEDHLARPGRVLLAGDLNSTPLWPAYRRLRRHLDDGVAAWAAREQRLSPRTWGPRPWWPAVLRIDHVLVRGLTVSGAEAHRVVRGDHRALLAEIRPADPEPR